MTRLTRGETVETNPAEPGSRQPAETREDSPSLLGVPARARRKVTPSLPAYFAMLYKGRRSSVKFRFSKLNCRAAVSARARSRGLAARETTLLVSVARVSTKGGQDGRLSTRARREGKRKFSNLPRPGFAAIRARGMESLRQIQSLTKYHHFLSLSLSLSLSFSLFLSLSPRVDEWIRACASFACVFRRYRRKLERVCMRKGCFSPLFPREHFNGV